ncbi:hypothetical protein BH10PSE7_BH10PSE7_10370 [soil metagenome]
MTTITAHNVDGGGFFADSFKFFWGTDAEEDRTTVRTSTFYKRYRPFH